MVAGDVLAYNTPRLNVHIKARKINDLTRVGYVPAKKVKESADDKKGGSAFGVALVH